MLTLKPNIGSSLKENDNKINLPAQESFKSLSEVSKIDLKALSVNQQENLLPNQTKPRNESHFTTLKKLPSKERTEIITLGFQLQNEGKISLRKYYESDEENSLFQFKGYSIKYESVRKDEDYKKVKKSNQ